MRDPADLDATRLAAQSLAANDPTGWFERLYAEARDGVATVPWDRGAPNALLVDWFTSAPPARSGAVMVVGSGPGRDAEYVASLGYPTSAFDVSPTAIEQARVRHPDSPVDYQVADLFALPQAWGRAFALVIESHTVQSLPPELHASAIGAIASLVAPGGALRVLGAVPEAAPDQGPPWPLTRDEVASFAADGLREVSLERVPDATGSSWRWRAEFARPEQAVSDACGANRVHRASPGARSPAP